MPEHMVWIETAAVKGWMSESSLGRLMARLAESEGHKPGLPRMEAARPQNAKYLADLETVANALTDEWQTSAQIADGLGISQKRADYLLTTLNGQGRLEKWRKYVRCTGSWKRNLYRRKQRAE